MSNASTYNYRGFKIVGGLSSVHIHAPPTPDGRTRILHSAPTTDEAIKWINLLLAKSPGNLQASRPSSNDPAYAAVVHRTYKDGIVGYHPAICIIGPYAHLTFVSNLNFETESSALVIADDHRLRLQRIIDEGLHGLGYKLHKAE